MLQVPTVDQTGAGAIAGRVTDSETGSPLQSAHISIEGTVLGTFSNRNGEYRILDVPEGSQRVRFSVMGYRVELKEVTVRADTTVRVDAALEPTPLALPDVVITAARKQQRVEEAASSVVVLEADELRVRAAPRLDVVLPLVPGITMVEDQLGIRGSTGYNRGAGGRVLVMLDGVPALGGDTGSVRWDTLPAEIIRRVEVVKGAASALYGSSAMGGVVNVLTRSAHSGPSAYTRFRTGSWDKPYHPEYRYQESRSWTYGGEATVVRPVGELGLLASGGYEYTAGFRENGWGRFGHLLLKIEGPQGERNLWSAVATLARNERGHFVEWRDVNEPYRVANILKGDWLRSDKLMITSTWRRLLGKEAYLQIQPHFFGVRWKNYFHDNDDRAAILRSAVDAQAVASSALGTVTAGGMAAATTVDAADVYGKPRVWEEAVYLQNEVDLTASLRISVGGRLDIHDTSATPKRIVFSPKTALIHTPSENVTLRLTAGKGFRAPSVAETFASMTTSGFTVIPNQDLEPETVWGGEIGGSWIPLPVVRVEGSVFHNHYSSMIEGVARPDGYLQFQNVRSARLQGVELSLQATLPSGRLRGGMSYMWLSTRDDKGVPLAYRRPRRGSITLELRGDLWSLASDLIYGAAMRRIAVYRFERRLPMYRLDGRLIVRVLGMRVILQGRNLTQYCYTDIERNLSPPREWLLSLERSW